MYTYAHPIEDALERITHSFCTLEFEDQRPFYDWLLERLAEGGLLARPLPKQVEFGRLNLSYVITSKRKLKALVDEGLVGGGDDHDMEALAVQPWALLEVPATGMVALAVAGAGALWWLGPRPWPGRRAT